MPIDVKPVDTGVTAPDMTQQAAAVEQGVSAAAMSAIPQAINIGLEAGSAYKDAKAEKSVDLAIEGLVATGEEEAQPLAGMQVADDAIGRMMRSQAQFGGGAGGMTGLQARVNQAKASVLAANPGREAEVHRYFDAKLSGSGIQSAIESQAAIDKEARAQAAKQFDTWVEVGVANGVNQADFYSNDPNVVRAAMEKTSRIMAQRATRESAAFTQTISEPEVRQWVRGDASTYRTDIKAIMNETLKQATGGAATDIMNAQQINALINTRDLDFVHSKLTESYTLAREAYINDTLNTVKGATRAVIEEELAPQDALFDLYLSKFGTTEASSVLTALDSAANVQWRFANPDLVHMGRVIDAYGPAMNIPTVQAVVQEAFMTEEKLQGLTTALMFDATPGNYTPSLSIDGAADFNKTASTTRIIQEASGGEATPETARVLSNALSDASYAVLQNPDAEGVDAVDVTIAVNQSVKLLKRYTEEVTAGRELLDIEETDKLFRNLTSPGAKRFAQERPEEWSAINEDLQKLVNTEADLFTKELVEGGLTQFPISDIGFAIESQTARGLEAQGQAAGMAGMTGGAGMALAQLFTGATEVTPQDVPVLAEKPILGGQGSRPYVMADLIRVSPTPGPVSELILVWDKPEYERVKELAGEAWTPAIEAELNQRLDALNASSYDMINKLSTLEQVRSPLASSSAVDAAVANVLTTKIRLNADLMQATGLDTASELPGVGQ